MESKELAKIKKLLEQLEYQVCTEIYKYDDNEFIELTIQAVKNGVSEYSFSDLDDIYANGMADRNLHFEPELEHMEVGYALLTRYNLPTDKYIEWSKRQKKKTIYYLLALVGVDGGEYKRSYENNEMITEKKEEVSIMLSDLKEKAHLLEVCQETTGLAFCGNNITINEICEKYIILKQQFGEISSYGMDIFRNGYENRCTKSFEEFFNNLLLVYRDAQEAAWMKCAKFLSSQNVSEADIQEIKRDYFDIVLLLDEVRDLHKEYYAELKNSAEKIEHRDATRRDTQFIGGGYGIGGAIAGMVTSSIAAGAYGAYCDMRVRGDIRRLKKAYEKDLSQIYNSKEAKEMYLFAMEQDIGMLELLCKGKLGIRCEEYEEKEIDDLISKCKNLYFFQEKYDTQQIALNLLLTYPDYYKLYAYLFELFPDEEENLCAIARRFGFMDCKVFLEECREGKLYIGENAALLDDICFTFLPGDMLEIDSIPVADKRYKVILPFKKTFFSKYEMYLYIKREKNFFNIYLENCKTKEILHFWAGVEGKSTFEKETNLSNEEILEKVDSYINFSIKDFSQTVICERKAGYSANLLVGKIVGRQTEKDAYLGQFSNEEVFISFAVGKEVFEQKDKLYYEKCIRNVLIEGINDENTLQQNEERAKQQQREKEERERREYLEERKDIESDIVTFLKTNPDFDIKFATEFSKRFKMVAHKCKDVQYLVCAYDFEQIEKNQGANLFLKDRYKESPNGKYILYFDGTVLLTNEHLYMGQEKICLKELTEIVNWTSLSKDKFLIQVCTTRKLYEFHDKILHKNLIDYINTASEFYRFTMHKNRPMYDRNYNTYTMCGECRSLEVEQRFFRWSCKLCRNGNIANLYQHMVGSEISHYREIILFSDYSMKRENTLLKDERILLEIYSDHLSEIQEHREVLRKTAELIITKVNQYAKYNNSDADYLLKDFLCRKGFYTKNVPDTHKTDESLLQENVFCTYCGKKIMRSVKFCNYCGKENKYRS